MLKEFSNNESVKTISLSNQDIVNGVVIISHGMSEHMGRYKWLITQLNNDGYHVVANDHRGHGKWIVNGYKEGVFSSKDGWDQVTNDLIELINSSHIEFPNQIDIPSGDCALISTHKQKLAQANNLAHQSWQNLWQSPNGRAV